MNKCVMLFMFAFTELAVYLVTQYNGLSAKQLIFFMGTYFINFGDFREYSEPFNEHSNGKHTT